jgi:hypothetical protein
MSTRLHNHIERRRDHCHFTARKGALFLVVRGLHPFNEGGSYKASRR